MQLTEETFGRLQGRLDDLEKQAAGPLREQVITLAAASRGQSVLDNAILHRSEPYQMSKKTQWKHICRACGHV